jgi:hypothetical protein
MASEAKPSSLLRLDSGSPRRFAPRDDALWIEKTAKILAVVVHPIALAQRATFLDFSALRLK